MGPNNFESQIYSMQQQGYNTSGSQSSAGNAMSAFGAVLGLAELAYNISSNERNYSAQKNLNALSQSNFENQYRIMSRDLAKAGFNSSALLGGVQNSAPPSLSAPQVQSLDISGLASLISALNNSRLTASQARLNNAQADKAESESVNEKSLFNREVYLRNLEHFNTLSEDEKRYEYEKDLKLMQQTFDSEQNELARENAINAIITKAKTDSILQKQIDDMKSALQINEYQFKKILMDKYLSVDFLKFKLGQYQDKKKFLADINFRLRQLGVEKVFKSIEALQGFQKLSLDSINSAMGVMDSIPLK